jgi:2-oxoisovalerate dehydrogenase E1 component alpha subunit
MSVPPPTRADSPAAIQLLTPEGERVSHPDYDAVVDGFDDQLYRDLYRDMALVRRVDVEATALQRQGQLGLWASCLGQEAAQVGSARALRPKDYAFPTYRDHGVTWSRGIDPTLLLRQFCGLSHGGWDPQEYRCGLYSIVIGSQALHATGYAMGVAKDGAVGEDGEAVIVYFGDGASSQGDVSEAMGFASVFTAPIVFFCQNNGWAISQPTERQSRVPIAYRAHGYGFEGIRVDGNDVLACYAVTQGALDGARTGQGPVLIEAMTYRMGAHTTSDDPSRYRLESELDAWKRKDPLDRMAEFLRRQQLADTSWFEELENEADVLAARLREECLTMQDPGPLEMFDHVYAEPTPPLLAQRREYADYLSTLTDIATADTRFGGVQA